MFHIATIKAPAESFDSHVFGADAEARVRLQISLPAISITCRSGPNLGLEASVVVCDVASITDAYGFGCMQSAPAAFSGGFPVYSSAQQLPVQPPVASDIFHPCVNRRADSRSFSE